MASLRYRVSLRESRGHYGKIEHTKTEPFACMFHYHKLASLSPCYHSSGIDGDRETTPSVETCHPSLFSGRLKEFTVSKNALSPSLKFSQARSSSYLERHCVYWDVVSQPNRCCLLVLFRLSYDVDNLVL